MIDEDVRPPALITIREMLAILWRRRWWLVVPLLLCTIGAAAVATMMTPRYRSTATLLIASQDIPTSFVASPLTNYADERIAKIRQQILSRANIVELVESMRLFPDERRSLPSERVQDMMRNAVSVDLVSASNGTNNRGPNTTIAFSLSFTYHEPAATHAVADRLTRMFIDEDKRLRTEQATGTAAFLSRRGNEIRDRLVELESRRRGIEARYSGALPDQVALSTQSNAALRAEVSRIDTETQGLMQQNSLLAARSQELGTAPDPALDALRRAEERLAQLGAIYSEEHPDVARARAAVTVERHRALSRPTQRTGSAVIASEIAAAHARIASLSQRRAELVGAISQMESLTSLAPQAAYELNNLERDYDNLTQQYQGIREKQMEAQVAANLQAEDKGERFSLVDPPNMPFEPVEPDKKKLLMAGMGGGVAIGLALIVLLEMMNGPINGEAAIHRVLGAPPMVVIPMMKPLAGPFQITGLRGLLPRPGSDTGAGGAE